MKQNYRFILFIALSVVLLLLHISRNWTITTTSAEAIAAIKKEQAFARKKLLSFQQKDKSAYKHIFIYHHNNLVSWPDNKTPAPQHISHLSKGLVELSNGIYVFDKLELADSTAVFLKLVQHNSQVKNKYLQQTSHFPGEISLEPKSGLEQLDYSPQKIFFRPKQTSLSSFKLFNPEYYASSQLNASLGFVFINLIWLISLIALLSSINWKPFVAVIISSLTLLGSVCLINFFLSSLIFDSTLSLNPFNVLNLDSLDYTLPVLLGLLAFLFLQGCSFFVSQTIYRLGWFLPTKPRYSSAWIKRFLPVLLFSLGVLFIVNRNERIRTTTEQQLIAEKLANHDDPIVEYLIEERIPELELHAKSALSKTETISFLNKNLFSGYLSAYQAANIDSAALALHPVFTFRFLGADYGFTSRYAQVGFGFPQLLANREFSDFVSKGYSNAIYVDRQLVQSTGTYSYPRLMSFTKEGLTTFDQHQHLIKRLGNEVFVISYPTKSWAYYFSFGVLVFAITVVAASFFWQSNPFKFNTFQQRTRMFFVLMLAFSGITFGAFAYYYLYSQFEEKNRVILTEKMESVKAQLAADSLSIFSLPVNEINARLASISGVMFTDVTLYRKNGQLLSSSQYEVFSKGLLSDNMMPKALYSLKDQHLNLIICRESIGKLKYLSAYSPLIDESNHVLGYINLPYFAKQVELNNELSSFLASVIAVWVLLTVVGFLIAILLANRITQPLKLIQAKLQQLDLKKGNQQIDYQGNDEIGDLVIAYNQKVEEILIKAEALAKNERELAWREMAKQVAHEIKNPLTPIKLNAQLLQRSLEKGDENLTEKTKRFVSGLIDQINTLTKIANEFSNYASLPKAIEEEVNLVEVIRNVTTVMSHEGVELSLAINASPVIIADKNLMTRVINNLLKNAYQAAEEKKFEDGEVPLIQVSLEVIENFAEIKITDNGIGISAEQHSRIFTPSFTTKSTGMGLGLAMVKQIVEQAGGAIFFESTEGKGTTFTIQFPTTTR